MSFASLLLSPFPLVSPSANQVVTGEKTPTQGWTAWLLRLPPPLELHDLVAVVSVGVVVVFVDLFP